MTRLSYDRYCEEILTQTDLLREALRHGDLTAKTPTCPDWTLAQLALHVSSAQRGVEGIVRDRVKEFRVPTDETAGTGGAEAFDADSLDAHLAEGARQLVETLREAGPETEVWTFGAEQTAAFWARRMTLETVMHRADVFAAVGAEYTVDAVLAADCLDEWLEIVTSPQAIAYRPAYGELAGPGRTLHLHATDTDPELNAEWFIDAREAPVTWRNTHEKAAVAVRGPMTAVLRVMYRRSSVDDGGVEVLGDREVLDSWLERASF
ncbi:maleylpyruvate isomerase N-terminal domain-containing protein [Streptomyces sp. NPDC021096]|uniref:maleylpyruvate isomerase N-terminal domain-containing protein n=1 Tax=Streptomyces sp. NPDC021096 TaxID=3154792 RepID=UPI003404000B